MPYTPAQFATQIKEKFPEYREWPDDYLVKQIIEKHPEYEGWVNFAPPPMTGPLAEAGRKGPGVGYDPGGVPEDDRFLAGPRDVLSQVTEQWPAAFLGAGAGGSLQAPTLDPESYIASTEATREGVKNTSLMPPTLAPLPTVGEQVTEQFKGEPEGLSKDIRKPIYETAATIIPNPLTYTPFHEGIAVVRNGAAAIFGVGAAWNGMVSLSTAADRVKNGDPHGALQAMIQSGIDGALALVMLRQLQSGKSAGQILREAGDKGPATMPPGTTQPGATTGTGTPGQAMIPDTTNYGKGNVMAPPPPPGQLPMTGEGGPAPSATYVQTPEGAITNDPHIPGQTILRFSDLESTTPPVEPIAKPTQNGVGDIEEEFNSVREEGKKLKISNDETTDTRIKEPPFTLNDLRGLDSHYAPEPDNPIPDIRASEPLPNKKGWSSETGALEFGGRRQWNGQRTDSLPTWGDMAYELRRNMLLPMSVAELKTVSDVAQAAEHPFMRLASAFWEETGLRPNLERISHGIAEFLTGEKAAPTRDAIERKWSNFGTHLRTLVDPAVWYQGLEKGMDGWNEKPFEKIPHASKTAIPGEAGKAIRVPQRALSFITNFFGELASQTEEAVQKENAPWLKNSRLEDLPPDVQKKIVDAASEKTLTGLFGAFGRRLNALREAGGKWPFPFLNVASNMIKGGYQRSPLYLGEIFVKAGKGELKGGDISDELAKVMIGTIEGVAAYKLAQKGWGYITGHGPISYTARENKEQSGWQETSFHFGNQYISYAHLGPIAVVLGAAADLAEAQTIPDKNEKSKKLLTAITDNLTPRFIIDFGNLIRLANVKSEDWGKNAQRFIGNLISSSVIPRVVSRAAAAEDSDAQGRGISRKTETIPDYVMRDIPGLREKLPPLRGATGEPVVRDASAAERFLSPFARTTERPERVVEKELDRIGWTPRATTKTLSVLTPHGDVRVELTDQEQSKILDANSFATQVAKEMISSPEYRKAPIWLKRKMLGHIYSYFRGAAMRQLRPELFMQAGEQMSENPALAEWLSGP